MIPEVDEENLSELSKVRARVHRMNDMVQAMAGKLLEHGIKIEHLETRASGTATREQLDSAMLTVGLKMEGLGNRMEAAGELVTQQIQTLTNNLTPIRNAVYWVVGLVMTGVVGGILALLFRKPLL